VLKEATEMVRQSAMTIPAREDAVYNEIMRHTVGMNAIDVVKGKILDIAMEHLELVNAEERATHVLVKANKELEEATSVYQISIKNEEKYIELTDNEKKQVAAAVEYREGLEVEDMIVMRY